MADDSEFIIQLTDCLNEKEAQLYFHLFKYGSKSLSMLAKSLKTYKEDVYLTLAGLVDKGVVKCSLKAPTVYTAEELGTSLDATFENFEGERHEMEMSKQELQGLLNQQSLRRPDEFATYKIFKTVQDVFSHTVRLFRAAVHDITFILPAYALPIVSKYGDHDNIKMCIQACNLF
ncbi:MAG TPA: helix-turn-helix domain-containing protein [Candidatus Acidoferrum sp.]|nr:helix-turn-helix domain-containing protein [Candidatus Acidoferrum sp.]